MKWSKTKMLAVLAAIMMSIPVPSFAQSAEDLATMQTFLDIMDGYFGIIESTYEVSSSAEKSAILQMTKIKEVYEERGEKARAVEVLREVLAESRSPTIRNAAYFLLSETLKETGNADKAVELLRQGLAENIKAAQ